MPVADLRTQAPGAGVRPGLATRAATAAACAALLAAALAIAGCASPASRQAQRAETVATTPLADLNLIQAVIPEVLQAAQKSPYGPPDAPHDVSPGNADARGCMPLQAEIDALDEALGPDLDAPPNPNNPGLIERGTTLASDAAFGALQRTVEGVVPFRGWVRKLSGAERRSREVAAAIAAGGVRRGFLKGVRVTRGCPVPVPVPVPVPAAVPGASTAGASR